LLLRLCITRMFHGGGEPGVGELDLGIGVIAIMLAMAGDSGLSSDGFEKYGSLIRFLARQSCLRPLQRLPYPTNISSSPSPWW